MKRKHYRDEQIAFALRQAEAGRSQLVLWLGKLSQRQGNASTKARATTLFAA